MQRASIRKAWLFFRCIPKSIYFNFRYLPVSQALKLPVLVSHRVALQEMRGNVQLKSEDIRFNMIRIGFHDNPAFDRNRVRAVWHNLGSVIFEGTAYLGNGTAVANLGKLTLGDNFQLSGNSQIVCREKMYFGSDTLIGWDCLFMDSDAHTVFDSEGKQINPNRPVRIGRHVWFGARCTVTKGSVVPDGCVVAANSSIHKVFETENAVIGGTPARILRGGIRWEC